MVLLSLSSSCPHRPPVLIVLQMQSPVSSLSAADVSGPPTFTKLLQDAQASEGQVVVLECRVRGGPPLQVRWYRQGEEIVDSPDFRVLQKKPRSASEPEEICTLVISEAFPEDGGVVLLLGIEPAGLRQQLRTAPSLRSGGGPPL
ncbi:hypothetical protein CgunFtcFv8_027552 [Champsocephalus gunnari]|uniref:Ig-like domain-containing protein n=1 Tax=Champsocephalus gunnari TaxID=52237 RepID=A0AAN8HWX3_CHAGU|nr:hypothetical protein CgunFtcFv8_027552 [Champsocephalus gunnari]